MAIWPKKQLYHMLVASHRRSVIKDGGTTSGLGEPALWHALVIIFLEYFSWGLLTVPIISVLAETFPTNKFLMNGLILGVKGLLSFLSAPLLGALSDIWGRKLFLILTVFSTCMPIPLLTFSPWWYFALFSISGLFSATYSIVLAYVADITDKESRNSAYGIVSATFGASLVTSPALGAFLSETLNKDVVVALATAIACLDVFFIMVAVPESLPAKLRHSLDRVTWESADPFATLRKVGEDSSVMLLCLVVFLSYLPEAGQFSCFFVYLKLVVGFSPEAVAAYIGVVGVLSVVAQTVVLIVLHRQFGCKRTILISLFAQAAQLVWYGFSSRSWMMWAAGILAALSQISYPSVSSYLSIHSDGDKQGTVQGIVTGIRGLCQGFGPALFGLIFYLFDVDLNSHNEFVGAAAFPPHRRYSAAVVPFHVVPTSTLLPLDRRFPTFMNHQLSNYTLTTSTVFVAEHPDHLRLAHQKKSIPGPPFLFGACLVICAIFVLQFLPSNPSWKFLRQRQSLTHDSTSLLKFQQRSFGRSSSPPPPSVARRYRTSDSFSRPSGYLMAEELFDNDCDVSMCVYDGSGQPSQHKRDCNGNDVVVASSLATSLMAVDERLLTLKNLYEQPSAL